MKTYDFIFSCGLQCGCSMALRAAGMQFASYPFDWVATQSFKDAAETIAADFADWLHPEDLQLLTIRRGGFNKHIYVNKRTGYGFAHDFSSFKTFEENFPKVAMKYARRIERLQKDLAKAKRILAVCVEMPNRTRCTNESLIEARQILMKKYPQASFDLLYFYELDDVKVAQAEEIGEGVTVAGLDYRTFEFGELNHEVHTDGIVQYLKANVAVPDPRTEEEKAAYEKAWAKQDKERWGTDGAWAIFKRRTAYRIYRKLEKYLIKEGLIPRERPLWGLWK
jgi:disulfide oxidoreductase YuzD